jgi:L-lactate dehydrogenase complex protein LldG
MSERENILGRVQEALRVPAPLPEVHRLAKAPAKLEGAGHNRYLPKVGADYDAQLKQFAANAADLKAEFIAVKDTAELNTRLAALSAELGWKKIAAHQGELVAPAAAALGLPAVYSDREHTVDELESCDAGLTECEALIAQTGSVLVTSRNSGGRALTVLPPHHVVIARREQLIPSLPDAFALLKQRYQDNYPSMISFITGPSRTGDIERILVLGAHGPKKLTIIMVG